MRGPDDPILGYCSRLLRGGEGDPSVAPAVLAATVRAHGVAGLLLETAPMSQPALAPQRVVLMGLARQDAVRDMAATLEVRRVLDILDEAGIASLVLKGTALALWLYREPWHRARSDFDLLVPDKAAAKTVVDLLLAQGYGLITAVTPDIADGYEVALQRGDGIVIDLHWRLLNTAVLARALSWQELDADAIALPSLHPSARGLGQVHALCHALLHRVTNLAKGDGNRLIWLFDVHLLASRMGAQEWSAFLRLCADKGIAMPSLHGLRATRAALGTPVPAEVETALDSLAVAESWQLDGIDQGAIDRSHLASLSWKEKPIWLWRKLLPSPAFMRYRYGVQGRWALAKAYAARWWFGLRQAVGWRKG